MVRLAKVHGPRHAGKKVSATLRSGEAFVAEFDKEGFAEVTEAQAKHLEEHGGGHFSHVRDEKEEAPRGRKPKEPDPQPEGGETGTGSEGGDSKEGDATPDAPASGRGRRKQTL